MRARNQTQKFRRGYQARGYTQRCALFCRGLNLILVDGEYRRIGERNNRVDYHFDVVAFAEHTKTFYLYMENDKKWESILDNLKDLTSPGSDAWCITEGTYRQCS